MICLVLPLPDCLSAAARLVPLFAVAKDPFDLDNVLPRRLCRAAYMHTGTGHHLSKLRTM